MTASTVHPRLSRLADVLARYDLEVIAGEVDTAAHLAFTLPPGRSGLLVLEFLAWAVNRDWSAGRGSRALGIDSPPPWLNVPGQCLTGDLTLPIADVDQLAEALGGHLAERLFVPVRHTRKRGHRA